VLHDLANLPKRPTLKDIQSALLDYHSHRRYRVKKTYRVSNMMTRLEAMRSRKARLWVFYLQPTLDGWVGNRMSDDLIGAEMIEFLPYPQRALAGTMGFNPNFLNGYSSKAKQRILLGVPLILVATLSFVVLSGITSGPPFTVEVSKATNSGYLQFAETRWKLPTDRDPFNILVTVFSPSLLNIDASQRLQALAFVLDLNPMWLIWILESHRRASVVALASFVSFPLIYGIAFQILGIGVVGPIWFFLHYLQSSLRNFTAPDLRMIDTAASKTAFIAVLMGLTIPSLLMYLLPGYDQRLSVNVIWQAFPITTLSLHCILRKFTVGNTMKHDVIYNVGADLPSIRLSIRIAAAISAVCFNWVRWTSAGQFFNIFVPQWSTVTAALPSKPSSLNLVDGMRLFLQIDELSIFAAAFFWLALLLLDLKKEEMTKVSWLQALTVGIVGTTLLGPGALFALAWLWREETLASKTLKGAIVARTSKT